MVDQGDHSGQVRFEARWSMVASMLVAAVVLLQLSFHVSATLAGEPLTATSKPTIATSKPTIATSKPTIATGKPSTATITPSTATGTSPAMGKSSIDRAASLVATGNSLTVVASETGDGVSATSSDPGDSYGSAQMGTPENDFAIATALTDDGILAVGYTRKPGTRNSEAWVSKWDLDGTLMWRSIMSSSGLSLNTGIAVDRDIYYVLGYSESSFEGETVAGESDAFIAAFNSFGEKLWLKRFGASGWDQTNSLLLLPDGTLMAALGSCDAVACHLNVTQLDSSGNVLGTKDLGSAPYAEALALSSAPDGVYVSGVYCDGFPQCWGSVTKINAALEIRWTLDLGNVTPYALTAERGGRVNAVGWSMENGSLNTSAWAASITNSGQIVWAHSIQSSSDYYLASSAVALPAGRTAIVGFTRGSLFSENAGGSDAFVQILDADGASVEGIQFGSTMNEAGCLGLLLNGNQILVVGATNGDLFGSNAGGYDLFLHRVNFTP